MLVESAAGLSRLGRLTAPDTPLGEAARATLAVWVTRRLAREPVFRILGHRDFWGLDLLVTPEVLDPRPDTETVVEAALGAWRAVSSQREGMSGSSERRRLSGDRLAGRLEERREGPRVLDLGTGSGAILCALLSQLPEATGVGVDRSVPACRIARANADRCGVGERALVIAGDWGAALAGPFDLVVSNPPYIEHEAIAGLDPEVRDHDPVAALDGGPDGLAAYRLLAPLCARLLRPGGSVVLEVGWTQAAAVVKLLAGAGLEGCGTKRDLGGHERAVVARRPQASPL